FMCPHMIADASSLTTYHMPLLLFFLMIPHHPRSTLFPYTTLFRSSGIGVATGPARQTFKEEAQTPKPLGEDAPLLFRPRADLAQDRKSTRLNSSHVSISYAVFCLKKKNSVTTNVAPSYLTDGQHAA